MHRSRRRGLTPSETLIIAAVVAVLTLLATSRFAGNAGQGARAITIKRMEIVMDALERYAIDNGGRFPTTEQGLEALLEEPSTEPTPRRWRGPYIDDEQVLADAWDVPLCYVSPGNDRRLYDLWSNGADRAEGGDDADADVQSWDRATMIP